MFPSQLKLLLLALVLLVFIGTRAPAQPCWVRAAFADGGDATAEMRIVNAVNDIARSYPILRGVLITDGHLEFGVYAATYVNNHHIVFSDELLSTPALLEMYVNSDIKAGYHPVLGHCTPEAMIAIHEAAHVIDFSESGKPHKILEGMYHTGTPKFPGLSGYSFEPTGFNPVEALAEAFASVQCNGGTPIEKVLAGLLV